jgi:hypothetical protein
MLVKEKKYLYIIFGLSFIFIIFHFVTWNMITKKAFPERDDMTIGDLGRMSYLPALFMLRKDRTDLPIKHINYKDNDQADIITIGDSGSNGAGGGLNAYYQDYIATRQHLKVMNIQVSKKGFIETVLILNNKGILDKLNPRAIILEGGERLLINHFSKKINWDIRVEDKHLSFLNKEYNSQKLHPLFINKLNYNAVLYNFLYKYDDNAIFSKVYVTDLSKNLFSGNIKNKLLFYSDDLKNIEDSNIKSMTLLNDNLNILQNILKKKGIELYFIPAPDKYNLYSNYILNNAYPKSMFFEILRPLEKEYHFIDTKFILNKMLEDGVLDVYHVDDTHWNYIGREAIFSKIIF